MATMQSKKKSSGYVISIQDLGLNTVFRTKILVKNDAKCVLTVIQGRIDQVKRSPDHPFHSWTIREQRDYVKTGREPVPPQTSQEESLRLQAAVDGFFRHMSQINKARNTVVSYKGHLQKSLDYFGDIKVESIKLADLQEFVRHLSRQKITSGKNRGHTLGIESQKKAIGHLRMLIRWLMATRGIDQKIEIFSAVQYGIKVDDHLDQLNKWVDFEQRKNDLERLGIDPQIEGAFSETFFTKPQLEELLKELKSRLWETSSRSKRRLFATVCFAAFTGARRSEITRVRRSDILLEYGEVSILRRKGRKHTEFLRHKVCLPHQVIPYFRVLLTETPHSRQCIFVGDDSHFDGATFDEDKERKHAESLGRRLKRIVIGTKWENAVGWHMFRHSLASILLSEGKSQMQVKEVIGWCTDEMAQRYQHMAQTRKAEIIQDTFAGAVF